MEELSEEEESVGQERGEDEEKQGEGEEEEKQVRRRWGQLALSPLPPPQTAISPVLCSLPQELVPCPLTEEMLKEGLSLLCKTGNGLAHAYVKFEAKYKDLTDISLLEGFIHLRYVDLSENKLQDLSPLSNLTHLLWLKVDGNLLTSAHMQELPYLQVISFTHNQIKNMEGITHPHLASLSLKGNKIQAAMGLNTQALYSLRVLELRGNKLENTAGLRLPKLKKLYLVRNQPAWEVRLRCCRGWHLQSAGGGKTLSHSKHHSVHASLFSSVFTA
uniref:Leucine-rich repeat-containing protein 23 n=1 Tax=Coturnix japonica TaxID=93934 RepID=A0A8C2U1I3_COTJA